RARLRRQGWRQHGSEPAGGGAEITVAFTCAQPRIGGAARRIGPDCAAWLRAALRLPQRETCSAGGRCATGAAKFLKRSQDRDTWSRCRPSRAMALALAAPLCLPRLDDLFLPLDGERADAGKLGIGAEVREERVVVHGWIGEKVSFDRCAKQFQSDFVLAAKRRVSRLVILGLRIPSRDDRRQSGFPLIGGRRRGAGETRLDRFAKSVRHSRQDQERLFPLSLP